ncbi:hypothetical protein [Xylanibacter caecicola]|uniref:hypothetical protein n=1 Tax=Xylanibacter caecicola TaxID=2736294 RepID=UPI0025857E13|nr:hypothetical protein [Xylanibacter caecicola]
MQDIRTKIREILNMPETTDDMQLLNALRESIKKWYPTELDGENEKEVKTEEFQKLHNLYKTYKQQLEQEKKDSTALTVVTDEQKSTELAISQELDKIQGIIDIQRLEERINVLKSINKNHEEKIKQLKEINKSLEKSLYEAKQEKTKQGEEKITERYRKGIRRGSWGIAALVGALATVVPQIKEFLTNTIGITASSTVTVILICITIILLINSIINTVKNKILNNTISHFRNSEYMESNIKTISRYPYSTCTTPNHYISKKDINNAIRTYISQGYRKFFFAFDTDLATEHIVNSIILHYMEFNVIEGETTEFLDTLFKVRIENNF